MIKGSNKKQSISETWEISTERFVCYIDIMGFKSIVERQAHDRVYKMMKKVTDAMRSTESAFSTDYDQEGGAINLTMTTYSDSIMIYTKDGTHESMENFIGAVSTLTEDLFLNEIPYKGAVAYGMMTLDFKNSIYFGRPLIDAYLLSEELSFYGVVVHSTAEFKRGFRADEGILEYLCPFKTGSSKHYTVIPVGYSNDDNWQNEYETLQHAIKRLRNKTSGGLRKYIDNTMQYLEYVHENKLKEVGS